MSVNKINFLSLKKVDVKSVDWIPGAKFRGVATNGSFLQKEGLRMFNE